MRGQHDLQQCLLFLSLIFVMGMAPNPAVILEEPDVDLEIFVRQGCPHCEAAKAFLDALKKEQPQLRILVKDVGQDAQALVRLQALASELDVKRLGVPTFYVRGQLIVGFTSEETTGKQLKDLLGRPPPEPARPSSEGTCELQTSEPCDTSKKQPVPEGIEFPLLGYRTLADLGLPLFTILLGLLDGFNPCAMWVLLFLLSLLATLRDRQKMFVLAGTFVAVSGIVYLVFMAAWLNIFLLIGYSRITQLLLGGIAGFIGLINIKDFFAFRSGLSFSIPESYKPGLYTKVRQILQAENMGGALTGIIALAILVNLVELACTAGFPALYTHILTLQNFEWWKYYGYLGLYNLAYIADDAVMVTIAVITLSHRKLQEREGRWLKLLSGVVMLGLGGLLLGAPEKLF